MFLLSEMFKLNENLERFEMLRKCLMPKKKLFYFKINDFLAQSTQGRRDTVSTSDVITVLSGLAHNKSLSVVNIGRLVIVLFFRK